MKGQTQNAKYSQMVQDTLSKKKKKKFRKAKSMQSQGMTV